MASNRDWNESYLKGDLPWDTGRPSAELVRVVSERPVRAGRALEIGCGTGTNAVWLAQQGFQVTGFDLAPVAIGRAQDRARAAGVQVDFRAVDVLNLPPLEGGFDFFFDRGCYHVVRRQSAGGYVAAVAGLLAPGALGLVLTGNAREPHTPGPPVVTEQEIRDELGSRFEILDLREFRFDQTPLVEERFLGWSCLLQLK